MEPSETGIQNLSNFVLKKIINKSGHRESITVEGEFKNCEGSAILIFEKQTFTEEGVKSLCDKGSTLEKVFTNDVYGLYECFPPAELNSKVFTSIFKYSIVEDCLSDDE